MGKNQNTWSHRTKVIFHPLGYLAVFSARAFVFWQENVCGIRNASLADHRYTVFLNIWDNVLMDLKYVFQQYFTCICFLGFIRHNKTCVTWVQEMWKCIHPCVAFGEYDTLVWMHFHMSFTSMQSMYIIPLCNLYSTYIEIRMVEPIPRDMHFPLNNNAFPSQQYRISIIRNFQDLTLWSY